MRKDRFDYICQETEAGRDAFVTHPGTGEEGLVTECVTKTQHVVAQTQDGQMRCWDYHECDEIGRSSKEWPRR